MRVADEMNCIREAQNKALHSDAVNRARERKRWHGKDTKMVVPDHDVDTVPA